MGAVKDWIARLDKVLDAFFAHHIKLFAKQRPSV
jgi:hypothetical protein